MSLTYIEYNTELKSIANDLIEEAIESLKNDDETIDHETVRECISDNGLINELVDGHSYVIYTHSAYELLSVSDNNSAYFEEVGILNSNSFGETMSTLAYFAMYADLSETLDDVLDNYDFDELNDDK